MKKHGIAKVGPLIGKLANKKIRDYQYKREFVPKWPVSPDGYFLLHNVNIVDVDTDKFKEERAILVKGKRIFKLIKESELNEVTSKYRIEKSIDGENKYLIPGMSDLHCHISLISEFDMTPGSFYYHDAQREHACEAALMSGVTFIKDAGGAYDMVHTLIDEIENNRLLGPKILPTYEALSCKRGMWDMGSIINKFAPIIFGGRVLNFAENGDDIRTFVDKVVSMGSENLKVYLEERPLYGGKEDAYFDMFTHDQIQLMKELAAKYDLPLESHAMFIKGARLAIKHNFTNIAHLTVDAPYTLRDAEEMAKNNIGIVPTTGVGMMLSFNYGSKGTSGDEEVLFYRNVLDKVMRPLMDFATVPEVRHCYVKFWEFISEEMSFRKMPEIGQVYPERAHGFAIYAKESFKNFKAAGVKIGIGTDGGIGTSFPGILAGEFEIYERYGMTPAEILRCATLTNMEIIGKDNELGSITEGKYADMVLLDVDPLVSIKAMCSVNKVFKDGRLYVDNK